MGSEDSNKLKKLASMISGSQLTDVLKANWRLVAGICLIMIAETALTLAQPWPIRFIVDQVINSPQLGSHSSREGLFTFIFNSMRGIFAHSDLDFLFRGIGLLLIIYISNSVLLYFGNELLARLGQKAVLRIRKNLFSHLMTLPHSFFEKSRTGDLTSRIAKDTADIQDILESMITVFIRSIPTILGILFVSFMLDWIYSLTFVFVIPLVFWANVIFTGRTKNAIRRQRRIEGGIASSVQEVLYYHKAVATLSLEGGVVESFLANGRQSAYHGVQAGRFQGFLTGIIDLLVGLSTVLVLFVGVMRIIHGCLTVGQLMVFLTYLNSLFKPIREISKFTGRMAKSTAALERVEEIMHLKPLDIGATDLPHASEAPPLRGDIEFSSVSFGYGGEVPVLKEFSLSIPAGTKVAIVGASGSGKSTVLQMLMRLYDPERGKICIDAIDIRTLKLSSLRSQMAIVLQDSFIFNMSIADNIALAKPGASEQEILEAARQAEADEFISELPAGYETVLGEGGTGLSGGQKRRLAIARAFLRDAPIILLDEPTTGLDAASEKKVVEAIARLSKGRTTLLVTHQLSAAVDADLIVVVDRGEIVQCGTYEDLAGREGYFRELWSIQQG